MSTFNSPTDAEAATLVRSAQLNALDSATATAFGLLPDETILKRGRINYAVSTGSANAYLLSLTYAPGSYTDGDEITFKANHANTGAATVNVNSLGVKSLRRNNGDALVSGDLPINKDATFRYNSTSGYFEMQSQSAQIATDAAISATAAAASASAASTSETNASASASAASSSASSASTSATNSATSATNAATSATNAQTAETNAETAETNAAASASAASSSASSAATSATNAQTAKTSAETAETNAETAETNALTHATTALAASTALTGTSTTSLTPSLAEKVVTTQSGKSFGAGTFVMMVSDSNAAVWMYGPVTSYVGTTLTFTPTVIGTASAKSDWTIAGRVGARGATGATGTGITEQATGFTATGGTTSKTLTVDVDVTTSALAQVAASQAEMEAGTEAALRTMSPLRVAQAIAGAAGMPLLSTVTASASATVDVETTFDATYDNYLIVANSVIPATDGATLILRLKIGGAYSATNYIGHYQTLVSGTNTYSATANEADGIFIATAVGNVTNEGLNLTARIYNPAGTTLLNMVDGNVVHINNAGLVKGGAFFGANTVAGAVTGVRIMATSGNITSGTFRLYGLKNS